jgi:tetratricopeptide (TPR) repeat protein
MSRATGACQLGKWSQMISRRRAIVVLAAAIGLGTGSPCFSDPEETTPEVSAADPDYVSGSKALEAKNWTSAIKSFSSAEARNPRNADIQNYLGYAYRKSGKLDLAFKHYDRALMLNPRHRGAHEYIGEAYLIKGDLKSAQKHLAALREICSLPCEELTDLEREIARYVKQSTANPSR